MNFRTTSQNEILRSLLAENGEAAVATLRSNEKRRRSDLLNDIKIIWDSVFNGNQTFQFNPPISLNVPRIGLYLGSNNLQSQELTRLLTSPIIKEDAVDEIYKQDEPEGNEIIESIFSCVPPFLIRSKTWPYEVNEEWATLPKSKREKLRGRLSLLHLKQGLCEFSPEIFGFTSLKLHGMFLKDISLLLQLPMMLRSLTHADLSHNQLTDIAPLSGLTSLTHLDVSHNKLERLLFMFPEFNWNIDGNHNANSMNDVPKSISLQLKSVGWSLCGNGISQLRWVDYSHNLVRRLGGVEHWSHYPHLSYLDVSYNRISDFMGEDMVRDGPIKENYEISDDGYTRDRIIKCGLSNLSFLHTLNLSNNFISNLNGLSGLHVQNLIISNNSITGWEEETKQIGSEHLHQQNSTLQFTDTLSPSSSADSNEQALPQTTPQSDELISNMNVGGNEDMMFNRNNSSISPPRPSLKRDELLFPSIKVFNKVHKQMVEFDESEVESLKSEKSEDSSLVCSSEDEHTSSKTLEVVYSVSKKKKISMDVLYKSKKQASQTEPSSKDVSVMDMENNLTEKQEQGLMLLHFAGQPLYSEEEQGENSESLQGSKFGTKSNTIVNGEVPKEILRTVVGCACMAGQRPSKMIECNLQGLGGRVEERRSFSGEASLAAEFDNSSGSFGIDCEVDGVVLEAPIGGEKSCSQSIDSEEGSRVRGTGVESEPESYIWYAPNWELGSNCSSSSTYDEYSRTNNDMEEEMRNEILFQANETCNSLDLNKADDKSSKGCAEILFRLGDEQSASLSAIDMPACKSTEILFFQHERLNESNCELYAGDIDENSNQQEQMASFGREEVHLDVYKNTEVEEFDEEVEVINVTQDKNSSSLLENFGGEMSEDSATSRRIPPCSLKRISVSSVPECIGLKSLMWLTELHLEYNQISSLKIIAGVYCLSSLYLQYNLIAEIGQLMYLSELHQLSKLDLRGNAVSSHKDFQRIISLIAPSIMILNQEKYCNLHELEHVKTIRHKNPLIRAAQVSKDLLLASEQQRVMFTHWLCPELDFMSYLNTPHPVLLIVSPDLSRNQQLCQRLMEEFPGKIQLARVLSVDCQCNTTSIMPSCEDETDGSRSVGIENSSKDLNGYIGDEEFLRFLFKGSLASVVEMEKGGFMSFRKSELLHSVKKGMISIAVIDLITAIVLQLSDLMIGAHWVLIFSESPEDNQNNYQTKTRTNKQQYLDKDEIPEVQQVSAESMWTNVCSESDIVGGQRGGVILKKFPDIRKQESSQLYEKCLQECLSMHQSFPGTFHRGIVLDCESTSLIELEKVLTDMHGSHRNVFGDASKTLLRLVNDISGTIIYNINKDLENELKLCT